MAEQPEEDEFLVDWEHLSYDPMFVEGFVLTLSGTTPVPTRVRLVPRPIGIVPEDYNEVEVRGSHPRFVPQHVQAWTLQYPDIQRLNGRVGIKLVGATTSELLPPGSAEDYETAAADVASP